MGSELGRALGENWVPISGANRTPYAKSWVLLLKGLKPGGNTGEAVPRQALERC
jgi:hypothetical protein